MKTYIITTIIILVFGLSGMAEDGSHYGSYRSSYHRGSYYNRGDHYSNECSLYNNGSYYNYPYHTSNYSYNAWENYYNQYGEYFDRFFNSRVLSYPQSREAHEKTLKEMARLGIPYYNQYTGEYNHVNTSTYIFNTSKTVEEYRARMEIWKKRGNVVY